MLLRVGRLALRVSSTELHQRAQLLEKKRPAIRERARSDCSDQPAFNFAINFALLSFASGNAWPARSLAAADRPLGGTAVVSKDSCKCTLGISSRSS